MRRHLDLICWTLAAALLSVHTVQHAQQRRREEAARMEAEQITASVRAAIMRARFQAASEFGPGDYPVPLRVKW
jgi:hypothetical protein